MTIKKRNKKGQSTKVKIDEDLLKKVARVHCSYEEMAWIVGCSADTLQRRYRGLIDAERAHGYASLRKAQFRSALKGNPALLIYLGKVYLKQKPDEEITNEALNIFINEIPVGKVKKNGNNKKASEQES